MKIKLLETKNSELYFEDKFYKTGVEIEVPFSVAIRMSKLTKVEMNHDKLPYDPEIFHKEKKFSFTSDIDLVSGWGNVSYNLLKNSKQYDIALTGKTFNVLDLDLSRMAHKVFNEQGAMIWHEQPKEEWLQSNFSRNIAIVPFETTKIPKSWIKRINSFEGLIVPCKQNIDAFRESGVTIPIELVNWGYDPKLWSYIERPDDGVFTFGTMGALSLRKGTDVLIDAFREAFPPHITDVRLICKTSHPHYPFMVKDKRIEVQMTPTSYEELKETFFKRVDCFVFPTRGEGAGMPPMEAMATGIPAIVTGWSGPLEYMTPETGWLINHTMTPAKDFSNNIYKEDCGDWAEPSKEHLIELMRYAYNHQDEVKEKGKAAAHHMKENWTWEKKIKMFHNALNKFL